MGSESNAILGTGTIGSGGISTDPYLRPGLDESSNGADLRSNIVADAFINRCAEVLEQSGGQHGVALKHSLKGVWLFKEALPGLTSVRDALVQDQEAGDESFTLTRQAIAEELPKFVGQQSASLLFETIAERSTLAGLLYLTFGVEVLDSASKDIPRAVRSLGEALEPRFEDGQLRLAHGKVLWDKEGPAQGYDWGRKQREAFEAIKEYLVNFRTAAREYLDNLARGIKADRGD